MRDVLLGLIFLVVLACFFVQPAYAYLDPGTGSMLLQGLIGGIAAGVGLISLFYYRFKIAVSRWLSGKRADHADTH